MHSATGRTLLVPNAADRQKSNRHSQSQKVHAGTPHGAASVSTDSTTDHPSGGGGNAEEDLDKEQTRLDNDNSESENDNAAHSTGFYIVKPFQPDPSISYIDRDLSFAPSGLYFHDPQVQQQFQYFVLRDLMAIGAGFIMWSGCLLFPTLLIDLGPGWSAVDITCGLILFPLWCLEIYFHFFKPNTPRNATIRIIGRTAASICWVVPMGVMAFYAYQNKCHTAIDIVRTLGLPRPPITADWIRWSCRDTHSPFHMMQLTTLGIAVPLHPLIHAVVYVYSLILAGLSRLFVEHHPESQESLAAKFFVMWMVGIFFYILIVSQYKQSMRSFLSTVHVARNVQLVEQLMEEVDLLMCTMVPSSALVRICNYEPVADYADEATVLFSDMVQFTKWSSTRTPVELVSMLNAVCFDLDLVAQRCGVEKIKTIGDAYWAACNIPDPVPDHVERMTEFGRQLVLTLKRLNTENPHWGGVHMRIGVATGPLYGGILGTQQLTYEVYGETSRMATWIEERGVPGRVAVSSAVLKKLQLTSNVEAVEEIEFTHPEKSYERLACYVLPLQDEGSRGDTSTPTLTNTAVPHTTGDDEHGAAAKEEAKKRRQLFVEARANAAATNGEKKAGRGKLTMENLEQQEKNLDTEEGRKEATLETLELVFSGRKYKYCFYDFGDSEVEEKFKKWIEPTSRPLRMLCSVITLLNCLVLIVSIWMEDATLPVLNRILVLLSVLLVAVQLLLAVYVKVIFAQVVLSHVACFLFIVGLGFGVPRGTCTTTNDINYLPIISVTLLGMGNMGIVSAFSLFLTNFLGFMVVLFLSTDQVMASALQLFAGMNVIIIYSLLIVTEKQYRRQFADLEIADFLVWESRKRKLEQEVLLESMVPSHVIPGLMTWLRTDMAPSDAPTRRYPRMCVAFLRFCEPKVVQLTGDASLGAELTGRQGTDWSLVAEASAAPADFGLSNATMKASDDSQIVSANPTNVSIPSAEPKPVPASIPAVVEPMTTTTPHHNHSEWLGPAHTAMDEILSRFHTLDKVKTIGEVVMVAGPFQEQHSYHEAADQLLAAMNLMKAEVQIQAGLHVGEIVGSIVGNNRICFDIFGDAVNVASRAMTGGPIGKVQVTEEFYEHYMNTAATEYENVSGSVFSDPMRQEAKGKGYITVRQVVATNANLLRQSAQV